MDVKALIALLSRTNPDAKVYVLTKHGYPVQHEIEGVARQEDVATAMFADADEDGPTATDLHGEIDSDYDGATDVFVLGGEALGIVDHRAWDVAQRA